MHATTGSNMNPFKHFPSVDATILYDEKDNAEKGMCYKLWDNIILNRHNSPLSDHCLKKKN